MRYTIYRRVLACLCVLLVFFQILQVILEEHNRAQAAEQVVEEQEKLTLWYTDEKLNEYLVDTAAQFEAETGVEITLQLVTAVDFREWGTGSLCDLQRVAGKGQAGRLNRGK